MKSSPPAKPVHEDPPILLIDDDEEMAETLSFHLEKAGYPVVVQSNWMGAQDFLRDREVRLVILEIVLPGVDGIEICRQLKRIDQTSAIPVIFLTKRGSDEDRILGLEAGADDFVVKPFSLREMILRVKLALRKAEQDEKPTGIVIDNLYIDLRLRKAMLDGRECSLTDTEFRLLSALAYSCGETCARPFLIETVWGAKIDAKSRSLDTHICRLKEKLGPLGKRIQTVHSKGYALLGSAEVQVLARDRRLPVG